MLLVANHMHLLDPVGAMAYLPPRATLLVAEKHETHPILGPLFRSLGAIFLQRGEPDRKAIRAALKALESGTPLGIAPEGTRSPDRTLRRGKPGAGLLAWKTGAVIVPIALWGHEHMFSSLKRLRRAEVHVAFGPPFHLPAEAQEVKRPSPEQLQEWTDLMMQQLAAQLPPEYRGYYA
jgi:1-acyl-sn-glycerol-3-phosphate acyltransferase